MAADFGATAHPQVATLPDHRCFGFPVESAPDAGRISVGNRRQCRDPNGNPVEVGLVRDRFATVRTPGAR